MPRKSKGVLPGKRYPLNMRTTKELRDRIEAAAMASGRSLVQEVEARLEQSFQREDMDTVIRGAAELLKKQLGLPPDTVLPPNPHSGSLADRVKEQQSLKSEEDDNG
jgi:Arc-like DNA binding domain